MSVTEISGIVSRDYKEKLLETVERMAIIQHHGNSGGAKAELVGDDVCFGGTPIPNEDKTMWLVGDGNIHNHQELKVALANKGHLFTTNMSAEVILHAYEEYGGDCLKYLRGGFAFAIWNNRDKVLFAARDRIGIKPLFYYTDGKGNLLFASEMKGILGSGVVPKKLDLEAIYHYLFMKAFEQPSTPLKNVKSLLPGHFLSYKNGCLSTEQYWDIKIETDNSLTEETAFSQLRWLLEDSVKNHLQDVQPSLVAVLLSGGIDSSYLVALATDFYGQPVRTFHIGFGEEGMEVDESRYADIIAKHFHTAHTKIKFTATDILNGIVRMVWCFDTPVSNSGFKLFLTGRMGQVEGIKRYLLGEGAEIPFELSPLWQYYRELEKYISFMRIIPRDTRVPIYQAGEAAAHLAVRLCPSKYLMGLHGYFYSKLGYFKWKGSGILEPEVKKVFTKGLSNEFKTIRNVYRDHFAQSGVNNIVDKYTYTMLKTYTPNQQLIHYNSICAFYDADVGFPYLDAPFLDFCLNIPDSLKRRGKVNKYPLRKAAQTMLPPEIAEREGAVFDMPFDYWLQHELKPIVDHVFSQEVVDKRGIFDYQELRRLYDRFYIGRTIPWVDIWSFVVLEIWLQLYYDPAEIEKPTCTVKELLGL